LRPKTRGLEKTSGYFSLIKRGEKSRRKKLNLLGMEGFFSSVTVGESVWSEQVTQRAFALRRKDKKVVRREIKIAMAQSHLKRGVKTTYQGLGENDARTKGRTPSRRAKEKQRHNVGKDLKMRPERGGKIKVVSPFARPRILTLVVAQ